jgi:hypothetical protein
MRIVVLLALGACASDPNPQDPPAHAVGGGGTTDGGTTAGTARPTPTDGGSEAARRATVPVLGGTLFAVPDTTFVAASDPEHDRIVVYDTAFSVLRADIPLPAGAMPFRLAANDTTLFASLRDIGSIAVVDRATWTATVVPTQCLEPRGLAWDGAREILWVACADGFLEQRAADGTLVGSFPLPRDLRDVVPLADTLAVSVFRAARLLTIDPVTGAILRVQSPEPGAFEGIPHAFEPRVAWRLVPSADGLGTVMLHQQHSLSTIDLDDDDSDGAYGETSDPCSALVQTAMTHFTGDLVETTGGLDGSPLPVDLAYDGSGTWMIAHAGAVPGTGDNTDVTFVPDSPVPLSSCYGGTHDNVSGGAIVAVTTDLGGHVVLQAQSPFALWVDGARAVIETPTTDAATETSFALFHQETGSGLSCAGCHPESQDDAHVWDFGPDGVRRTQNLAVGLADTLPLHWSGEFPNLISLVRDVMQNRMDGPVVSDEDSAALLTWLDGVRPNRTSADTSDAVARGATLFYAPESQCTTCHGGDHYTSNVTVDVGTGELLQAPSLVGVGARAPYMHDGCAATLAERFTNPGCGGTAHGATISGSDVDDIVAFLETL